MDLVHGPLPQGFDFGERRPVEVVVKGAEGVVVGHQPQLGARVAAGAVRPDVAQDVLVPEISMSTSST